ncbi:uncharacterized protein LOC130807031 [Amaranthus tricolor]|uniref:uncharacterized protein LOC130807031 n=1 Tax=Amaranthus tricolor TaxID=29722 RepID=UPI00258D6B67|nr:uncharacterized protein LOC130807031 [Amaranthus tricolor]
MEHKQMLNLGIYVFDKCGCVLQRTHGLPCACYRYLSIRSHGSLYLDDIHPFWKTLKYLEAEEDANEEVWHANVDDKEYFQSLVDEVLKADPAVVRRMSQVLEHELHPDDTNKPEEGKTNDNQNRQEKQKSSSRGRSSGRSSNRSNQSSVGINFSFNLSGTYRSAGRDFSLFSWPNHIPYILPPYLFDWIDVIGDGNCGFRAITVTELRELVENAIYIIGAHSKGPALHSHWMEMTALYSAATFLNIAIAYYGCTDGNSMYKCLVLSVRRTGGMHGVNKLVHILWVNGNHYVQLLMNDDSSLLPPVQQNWRAAAKNSCRDLERQYRNMISLWNRLCGIQRPQHNNTAEDAVNLDTP